MPDCGWEECIILKANNKKLNAQVVKILLERLICSELKKVNNFFLNQSQLKSTKIGKSGKKYLAICFYSPQSSPSIVNS